MMDVCSRCYCQFLMPSPSKDRSLSRVAKCQGCGRTLGEWKQSQLNDKGSYVVTLWGAADSNRPGSSRVFALGCVVAFGFLGTMVGALLASVVDLVKSSL